MKHFYSLVFALSCLISGVFMAQEVKWQKDFKASTQNFISSVQTTIDQQFFITGSSIRTSTSQNSGNRNSGYDFHVAKLNQQGNLLWEKFYGGNAHDFLSASSPTQEGGFIIAGTSSSTQGEQKRENNIGGSDIWVIKLNENGEEEWQKTLGTSQDDEARSIVQSSDLGYFIAANIQNPKNGFGSKDVWMIRLDKTGKTIGETLVGGEGLEEIEKILPTQDGGCLLAIYSRSGISTITPKLSHLLEIPKESKDSNNSKESVENNAYSSVSTNTNTQTLSHVQGIPSYSIHISGKNSENFGEGDYWIVKLDKKGKVEWQKTLGGKEDEHIRNIAAFDQGFIVVGESRSSVSGNKTTSLKEGTDTWMVAIDKNGNELWQKSYSFGNRDVVMSVNTIQDNTNNTTNTTKGFLIGGYTQSEGKQIKKEEETFWMVYLNAKGEEIWRKHVEGSSKQRQERLVSAQLNRDGSYLLAGTSAQELGKENWKVVLLGDKDLEALIVKKDLSVYPNPIQDFCYVEIGVRFKEANIQVYDFSGKLILEQKTVNPVTKLNTNTLQNGAYIISVTTENNKLNAKIMKK